jgi:hypothetical protein
MLPASPVEAQHYELRAVACRYGITRNTHGSGQRYNLSITPGLRSSPPAGANDLTSWDSTKKSDHPRFLGKKRSQRRISS